MYSSERQVARLRLAYLRAVLSQEIGAFDTDLTSGKIISGISNHMSIIQDAIGEKVYKNATTLAHKCVCAYVSARVRQIKFMTKYMVIS